MGAFLWLRALLRGGVHRLKASIRKEGRHSALPLRGFSEDLVFIPGVDRLPDDELRRLNELLPWNAFLVDSQGRRFGQETSPTKRNQPQKVPDPRIGALNDWYPLAGKTVLEVGCFEGIHTAALASRAEHVIAVDGRVEHLVKTMVRCGMFGKTNVSVVYWDVEKPPGSLRIECDVLHHVGVLYHLTDPESHLRMISPYVKNTIMLDTHVSCFVDCDHVNEAVVRSEPGREKPFAGLSNYSVWLSEKRITSLLIELGFERVCVAERRNERNGPRVLIFASRTSSAVSF